MPPCPCRPRRVPRLAHSLSSFPPPSDRRYMAESSCKDNEIALLKDVATTWREHAISLTKTQGWN